jgi:hypothetical protein
MWERTPRGKPDELYDTSIDAEVEVLGVLCPKRNFQEVNGNPMETAVDRVSLPAS